MSGFNSLLFIDYSVGAYFWATLRSSRALRPGLLVFWPKSDKVFNLSWPTGRHGLCASLIGSNLQRLKGN